MSATDRDAYIAGLRDLADRLERNPAAVLPYHGSGCDLALFAHDDDELRATVRAVGGEKVTDDHAGFAVQRTLGGPEGLRVSTKPVYGACERVRVGTETVQTEEIVTPAVTRTVTVEQPVYEVRCPDSLLADTERTVTA